MSKAEIKKFVRETVKEIRDGLPEGFRIDDKIHFDISALRVKFYDELQDLHDIVYDNFEKMIQKTRRDN